MPSSLPLDQRLDKIQSEFLRRGALVLGLTFAPDVDTRTLSEVKRDAADMLEAFLEGRHRPLTDFGDPPLTRCA